MVEGILSTLAPGIVGKEFTCTWTGNQTSKKEIDLVDFNLINDSNLRVKN